MKKMWNHFKGIRMYGPWLKFVDAFKITLVLGFLMVSQSLFAKTEVVNPENLLQATQLTEELKNIFPSEIDQASKKVQGKVTDSSGNPLPGVSIVVKGTSTGTVSDADGNYSLDNVTDETVLVFSFIGLKTSEFLVGERTTVNVTLEEEVIGLEEVVAIGYGTRAKGALTGSISTAESEVLESRPVTNTLNAIQGILPGVTVTRSSGRPGQENYQLQIRGYSSKNGNQPLVLIDGIPGDLATLNPADIDNVTVLKDAAAAIYGARSADGVLLVTTKTGVKGKTQISYSGNVAVKTPSYVKNMATPYQLAKMFDEGRVNDGDPEKYTEDDFQKMLNNDPGVGPGRMLYLENYPNFYRNTEWGDVVFKNSILQTHNVNVNGGSDQIRFLVSGGYLENNGVFSYGENNSKRYNFRTNLNIKLGKICNWIPALAMNTKILLSRLKQMSFWELYCNPGRTCLSEIRQGIFTSTRGMPILPSGWKKAVKSIRPGGN
jgi:TonB-linked SusC/RagA family outer membrane protein